MHNDKNEECCGHDKHEGGCGHMMGMMGEHGKEFMAAKLEKKAAMLKIELEFIEKMKGLLGKSEDKK